MMEKKHEDGIVIARETFRSLDAKARKWKDRNVPVYIRQKLWIPYYLTEVNGKTVLFTIRSPDASNPKVHFMEYT